ncbi:hypothetical protein BZV78_16360 [Salmonella enterica subsp. enterica serovar Goverdhan]|nr:hypothetical protein [Salmonella enterica subsp. enterica serovar Goverdhan]EDT8794844.1 hypothetical protein [Salmonella enterica subsp. enterica]EKO5066081.1 hypothetical protein [Salmonella enterica]EBU7061087.1 hypothetical protein [Salmonella enterica subsp. enterica serovar Goverdhan]ECD2895776.1 hypothetical protein [Salmonella enterica subsp. enterica serovar Goverdhan]
MGSNIIELAKLGHERAAELKASCGAVDVRSVAQLISDLATQLEVQFVRSTNMAVQLANAESKCRELAAEVQAVRWACGQVYMKGYNHGHLNTVDGLEYASDTELVERGGETLAYFTDPDHCGVAADAILAEVGAQAVEMFAECAYTLEHHDHAVAFAAQLRKGVEL